MSKRRFAAPGLLVLAVVALAASGPAQADRGHGGHGRARVGVGIQFGPAYGYPAYPVYPGYVYPPPLVVVPAEPPQYIERSDGPQEGETASPPPPPVWHHCANPEGFYPYVRDCPGGWTLVPAEPPAR